MKKIITSLALTLFIVSTFAQTTAFSPGWYIIEPGNKFTVLFPGGHDYDSDGDGNIIAPDKNNLAMKAGEVVLAFENSKGKVYCFDPLGRMIAFDNFSLLTKAPTLPGCGVGLMSETIQLIGGEELMAGSFYWIVGQDLSKSTIKIQTDGGNIYDIPQDKISLLSATIKGLMKSETFIPVIE
jgi:hypothetical protein